MADTHYIFQAQYNPYYIYYPHLPVVGCLSFYHRWIYNKNHYLFMLPFIHFSVSFPLFFVFFFYQMWVPFIFLYGLTNLFLSSHKIKLTEWSRWKKKYFIFRWYTPSHSFYWQIACSGSALWCIQIFFFLLRIGLTRMNETGKKSLLLKLHKRIIIIIIFFSIYMAYVFYLDTLVVCRCICN